MGGFVYDDDQYRLRFEDPRFDGLEVLMSSLTIGQITDLTKLTAAAESKDEKEAVAAFDQLVSMLAAGLVSWNLERPAGTPVPATEEGIRRQPIRLVLSIVWAWMEGVGGVPLDFEPTLNGGLSQEAGSLPMEPASPNPPS